MVTNGEQKSGNEMENDRNGVNETRLQKKRKIPKGK